MEKVTIEKVNKMCYNDFIATFGNIFERNPFIAGALWSRKPFVDLKDLHQQFCCFVDDLPASAQEGVIRVVTDLGGQKREKLVSQESFKEQGSAGLLKLDPKEKERLYDLCLRYRKKFGFPCVICCRENTKETIFANLENRMHNTKDIERIHCMQELKKIARLRLLDAFLLTSKL